MYVISCQWSSTYFSLTEGFVTLTDAFVSLTKLYFTSRMPFVTKVDDSVSKP
ncbi:hypothetical protein Barb6_00464 [Bacteroidales bacterium Barb6]|nr:hypothetical protein Barb6_00464 [Bacteroidales bacterium Barb6]